MNEKRIKLFVPTEAQLRVYLNLREKGRYGLIPNDADLWRDILDSSGGRGISPFRNPGGGWLELEEFRDSVPPILRNYEDGVAPDCIAKSLGYESEQELYQALNHYEFQRRWGKSRDYE